MFKIGLKLWSINENYMTEAVRLFDAGIYNYIELFSVPGSYDDFIHIWNSLKIPFIIHAPHWHGGMNLASRESRSRNLELFAEAQKYADSLEAKTIITHPGIAGDINETIEQLNTINDKRILVENKPYFALDGGLICNGTSPEEISLVLNSTDLGFCLDFGHAICAANGHGQDPIDFISGFIELRPAMFHISDGDLKGVYDKHAHLGNGNFDLKAFISYLPADAKVSLETVKDSKDDLNDFAEDVRRLRGLELALMVGEK